MFFDFDNKKNSNSLKNKNNDIFGHLCRCRNCGKYMIYIPYEMPTYSYKFMYKQYSHINKLTSLVYSGKNINLPTHECDFGINGVFEVVGLLNLGMCNIDDIKEKYNVSEEVTYQCSNGKFLI